MLAPHAVDIAVIILSLIASLCFTFAEPFDDIFLFVKSKLCIGQPKYKQKFTTQGRKEGVTDWSTKRVNSRALPKLQFHIL